MADDPYSQYLGLPPGKRPPRSHELLGLPAKPTDTTQIDDAAARCMDKLDQFALSSDRATREQVQRLMNEVAKARTKLVARVPKQKPTPSEPAAPSPSAKPSAPSTSKKTAPTPIPPRPAARPPAASASAARPVPAFQSALLFWGLIGLGWAATLAVAFVLTFNTFKPDPLPAEPPPIAAAVERDNAISPDPDPGPGPEGIDASPADPENAKPQPEPVPPPDDVTTGPTGPTEQELAAEKAEQQRLARERKREEAARQAQANRQRLAEIRRVEDEDAEARWLIEEAEIKERLANYFRLRRRLTGQQQLKAIRDMLMVVNEGVEVDLEATYENERIVGLKVGVWDPQKRPQLEESARITDLFPLLGLPLKRLEISHLRGLETLDALRGMPLERLVFDNAKALKDIRGLRGLPLDYLRITYAPLITDLDPLRGMPLGHLDMRQCIGITTTEPLTGIALRSVNFHRCRNLSDLTGLEKMDSTGIVSSFYGTAITDLSPLKGQSFGQLVLTECNQLATLEGIEGAAFRDLNMTGMLLIEDLSPLQKVTIQSDLEIGGPKITDLKPLAGVTARRLTIKAENLRSLEGIEAMPNLKNLTISRSPGITDEEVERIRRAILGIEIYR